MVLTRMHWNNDTLDPEPIWTVVPNVSVIEAISRHHLIPSIDISTWGLIVTFLGEGSYNKAYAVEVKTTWLVNIYISGDTPHRTSGGRALGGGAKAGVLGSSSVCRTQNSLKFSWSGG